MQCNFFIHTDNDSTFYLHKMLMLASCFRPEGGCKVNMYYCIITFLIHMTDLLANSVYASDINNSSFYLECVPIVIVLLL